MAAGIFVFVVGKIKMREGTNTFPDKESMIPRSDIFLCTNSVLLLSSALLMVKLWKDSFNLGVTGLGYMGGNQGC